MLNTLDFEWGRVNIGYIVLNKLIYNIWNNYSFLTFICATWVISSYSTIIRKYSPYPWLSLFIFIIINYILSLTLVRQYLAMSFVFLATKCVIERKQLLFILYILIASTFHTTAIIAFPLYYIYGLNNTKFNRALMIFGTIGAILIFRIIVFKVLGVYITAYQNYTDNIYVNEAGIATWPRAIMKIYILGVYMYSMGKRVMETGINRFVYIEMLISVVICAGGIGLFGMFRLKEFFALSDIIGIPLIVQQTKQMSSIQKLAVKSMVLVYVILLIISFIRAYNNNFEFGYQFIWQ